MLKYLFLILILITSNFGYITTAQNTESILLPFAYNEIWNTDVINGRDDYGVHKDRLGIALDLYTDQSSMVLAPISGNFEQGCTSQGVTLVSITNAAGLKIRLIHLLESTLRQFSGYIKQGSPIGMTAPKGDYNSPGCNVASDGYHVHFSITTTNQNGCAYNVDGYSVVCEGMRYCDRSLDGSYALSFAVDCNRKYLNKKFVSTNGFPLSNSQCDSLIKDSRNWSNRDSNDVLNLQVCLTQANIYLGVYTRQLDDYTREKVNQYLNIPPTPTQAELNAQVEAAKKAEEQRLAEESKKAQEAQKAEDERLAKEYKEAKEKEAAQIKIQKIEEQKVIDNKLKNEFSNEQQKFIFNQNMTRNILILLTLLFLIVSSTLLLLFKREKKKLKLLNLKGK